MIPPDHLPPHHNIQMSKLSKSINLLIEFGQLPPHTAALFLRQTALGVQSMHRQGVKHNRLNLDNLLHDKMGQVWINVFTATNKPPSER